MVKNEIMKFEGQNVEVIIENGEPLFEIYSTGMALGQVKKNSMGVLYPRKERIDDNLANADVAPCVRNGHNYITEQQLYDLMLEMKTDKVRPFRRWVTNEVLPTIRKTGGYVQEDREEEFINIYFPSFTDETKLTMVHDLRKQNKKLKLKIEEQKPLVAFATQVSETSDLIDMGKMAKLLKDENINIGRNRLFEWLRSQGILMANNIPYQRYIEGEYFKVRERTKETDYGTKVFTTTYVTGKGQIYIAEKLRQEFRAIA